MRVLPLHGVTEVGFHPFDAGFVVVDAAGARVFGGIEVLDEEVRHVGEEEDGHFFRFLFFFNLAFLLLSVWLVENEE